jgi:hypothetical protein
MHDSLIHRLERLWDEPDGPLYCLRQGQLTTRGCDEVLHTLRDVNLSDPDVPRRVVSLLWYMPTFIGWQTERVVEHGGSADELRRFNTEVTDELERILGVP